MIRIFNGQERRLGGPNSKRAWIQVETELRQHLHLFKGARLAVFMAISLHIDSRGISFPSNDLLEKETGYNHNTVSGTLTQLCELRISDSPVLQSRERRTASGQFCGKEYRIFPSPDEVAEWESEPIYIILPEPVVDLSDKSRAAPKKRDAVRRDTGNVDAVSDQPDTKNQYAVNEDSEPPYTENRYTGKPDTAFPDTGNRDAYLYKKNHSEEEPIYKEETTTTRSNTDRVQEVEVVPSADVVVLFEKKVSEMVSRLIAEGVAVETAESLARNQYERCAQQLDYLPYHGYKDNRVGFLVYAIKNNIAPPRDFPGNKTTPGKQSGPVEKVPVVTAPRPQSAPAPQSVSVPPQVSMASAQQAYDHECATANKLIGELRDTMELEAWATLERDAELLLPKVVRDMGEGARYERLLHDRLMLMVLIHSGIPCPALMQKTNYAEMIRLRPGIVTRPAEPLPDDSGTVDASAVKRTEASRLKLEELRKKMEGLNERS